MCSYHLLAHSAAGYVIRCKGCTNYQLAFGTVVLSLPVKAFRHLQIQAGELKIITVPNGFPEQKRIRVDLPSCKNVLMMLSYHELNDLHNLLEEAEVAESLEQLLDDNGLAFAEKNR